MTILAMQLDWNQIYLLTLSNLKSRYRNTFWGFAWVVLNPTLMFCAQGFVFHYVLKLNVENYPLFLLTGVLPWIYWVQTIEMGTSLIVSNGRLLKSFPIHPFALLVSLCIENLVGFVASMLILIFIVGWHSGLPMINLLLLPIPVMTLFFATLGIAFSLALVNSRFRDTRFIVSFGLSVLYFVTPIFYPIEMVPEKVKWIIQYNPVLFLIEPFRLVVENPFDFAFVIAILKAIFFAVFCNFSAFLIWRQRQNHVFYEI